MCPAAQAKRGAVSDSTSGPKLRQGEVGGVRGHSLVSHFLSASCRIQSDGEGAHARWIIFCFLSLGLFRIIYFYLFHLHVRVCSEACAQLDVPVSGAAAALRFLSLTGNKVLLSHIPDAAPEGPNTKLSQLGPGFSTLHLLPRTVNMVPFVPATSCLCSLVRLKVNCESLQSCVH